MRMRGARPSPRHTLAAAAPHRIIGDTPPRWLWRPAKLSMWLNATYGDCVTAEEAFAKACHTPEIFIEDITVLEWATKNGVLNGADLITVLNAMQTGGFSQNSQIYNDGPPSAVDWTNALILQNAISKGPVKVAIAADQLENVVPDPPTNGWVATNFVQDGDVDHCVSLSGYGAIAWLASELGVTVPSGIDGSAPGYGLFTWSSEGIIDVPSMLAITGEAWLRNPTTITSSAKQIETGVVS